MSNFNLEEYISASISNLEVLMNKEFNLQFMRAATIILKCFAEGGKLLVCGNGGSNADAQHVAGELVNFFTRPHLPLPVITLGTNQTVTSAWGNDHGFEGQFAREVQAFGDEKSVLLGITTSGKSVNLNNAFTQARNLGMATIGLASERAREYLSDKTDCLLAVPGEETHKIQESHIIVYHALCIYIEQNLPARFTSRS
jgi:D-sedoheptulose 7-phosphate isomerase